MSEQLTPTRRCEECDPSFSSCWNDGSKCCKRPKQLTPTQWVKANRIAALEASQDVVDFDFALELATELERVKEESRENVLFLIGEWDKERDQLKRQVEGERQDKLLMVGDRDVVINQLRAQNAHLLKLVQPFLDVVFVMPEDKKLADAAKAIRQAIDEALE